MTTQTLAGLTALTDTMGETITELRQEVTTLSQTLGAIGTQLETLLDHLYGENVRPVAADPTKEG
jgi:hypothetical protein